MTRTERYETGLRPALSDTETVAGRLARTYVELSRRELSALGCESQTDRAAARSAVVAVAEEAEIERQGYVS